MKTPRTYKLSDITLARIDDIVTWLPAESATHAVEEAIAEFHTRLKARREIGDFQAELADLWVLFEQHHNYAIHSKGDGSVSIYNSIERAKWNQKGVLDFEVLQRSPDGIYRTAYTIHRLKELVHSNRWYVP